MEAIVATSQQPSRTVQRKPSSRARRAPETPAPTPTFAMTPQQRPPREEFVRKRAHEIWIERGCNLNDDLGDWLQAEREYWYQWGRD